MGPQFSLHYVHSPQDPAIPDRANGNPLAVSLPLDHQKTSPLTCPPSTLTFCPTSIIATGFVVLQQCTLSQQRARTTLRFQESPGVPPSQTGSCPLPGIVQTLVCAFLQVFAILFPGPGMFPLHQPHPQPPLTSPALFRRLQRLSLNRLLRSCSIAAAPWDINWVLFSLSF